MLPSAPSRVRPVVLVLALAPFLPAATIPSSEPIDPHGLLQIYCPGNIKFRGSSSPKLSWRTQNLSSITFTRQGRLIILQAPSSDWIEITAPRTLEGLNLHSAGGDLDISELTGSVVAQAAGRVAISHIGGNVELRSAGGPTSLTSIGGEIRCSSSGGAIMADSFHGGGNFQTGGGDIVIQKPSGSLRAWTGGGSIIATFFPGLLLMDSFLSTAAGDITVHLASNLHVRIQARNNGSADIRSIVSDYAGIRIKSLRNAVLAEGTLNGGGPLLTITGNGGSIYIRKK